MISCVEREDLTGEYTIDHDKPPAGVSIEPAPPPLECGLLYALGFLDDSTLEVLQKLFPDVVLPSFRKIHRT